MKKRLAGVSSVIFLLLLSFSASAHLQNDNPRASIAFVGPHVITGPAGSIRPGAFKVRVIDAQGSPLAGLKVWFYNNAGIGTPENPPPPASSFGSFQGPEDPLGVISDANGVATSPPYRFGSGGHDVVAGVYGVAGPENAGVGFPPLVAFFHVNYVPPEPPPSSPPPPPAIVPLPQGTSGTLALPASSVQALTIFTLTVLLLALLQLRKPRPGGRRRS